MSKQSKRARQARLAKQAMRAKQTGRMQTQQKVPLPSQSHRQLEKLAEYIQEQMLIGDFEGSIRASKTLLTSLPRNSPAYLEILTLQGLAHGMQKQYQQAYDVFSAAIALDPTKDEFWYNHGIACLFMSRLAEAVQDFERAVALTKDETGEIARRSADKLEDSRQELRKAMQAHGKDITLEQYMQREKCFTRAISLMEQERWLEAEQLLRQLTEAASGIAIYWGNLGICLAMLLRYDEAQKALVQSLILNPNNTIIRNTLVKLPEIQRTKRPIGLNLSLRDDEKQSLALYEKNDQGEVAFSSIVEKVGESVTSTWKLIGKQAPRYDFFLNPYLDTRFTTCPRCRIKTRARKFSLVIHVIPTDTVVLDKMCRFCNFCDMLIVHQDQLEKQLVTQFLTINPQSIGNAYEVAGTLEREEWNQEKQDQWPLEYLREHLHNFKTMIEF